MSSDLARALVDLPPILDDWNSAQSANYLPQTRTKNVSMAWSVKYTEGCSLFFAKRLANIASRSSARRWLLDHQCNAGVSCSAVRTQQSRPLRCQHSEPLRKLILGRTLCSASNNATQDLQQQPRWQSYHTGTNRDMVYQRSMYLVPSILQQTAIPTQELLTLGSRPPHNPKQRHM